MIVFAYKDVSDAACHIGLGVTALNLAASLHEAGISTETWPVFDGYALRDKLKQRDDVTHVVMLAPWIDTGFMRALTSSFPHVQFTVTCHSNVGFLQVDPWSMKTVREQMELERDRLNFHVSGNSHAYCQWVRAAYNRPCAYLPNLYHVQMPPVPKPLWDGGTLRIGIFGATRLLKNMGTAVAGALVIANCTQVETEIWVSGGREEGGKGVLGSCKSMVNGHSHARIVESPWQTWSQFQETVKKMHLMMQPSFTESFNNVTADGISQGVPSVVGPAIDWVPSKWVADPDDAVDIARVGLRLLRDKKAAKNGMHSLQKHNSAGIRAWKEYLEL